MTLLATHKLIAIADVISPEVKSLGIAKGEVGYDDVRRFLKDARRDGRIKQQIKSNRSVEIILDHCMTHC